MYVVNIPKEKPVRISEKNNEKTFVVLVLTEIYLLIEPI